MRKSLAIFCGLSKGASQEYLKGAVQLGEELVKRNMVVQVLELSGSSGYGTKRRREGYRGNS